MSDIATQSISDFLSKFTEDDVNADFQAQLDLKADKTSLTETNTNVTNLSKQVETKANQTDLDETTTMVTNLTMMINNNPGTGPTDTTGLAKQTDLDVTNQNVTSLTNQISSINTQLSSINLDDIETLYWMGM